MITATFLAIFFIPLFFVFVVQVFGQRETGRRAPPPRPGLAAPADGGSLT